MIRRSIDDCLSMHTFNHCKKAESLAALTSAMKIYFLVLISIELLSAVQYNQPCTFSSDTCHWSIGRRWHVVNLDDENKVLTADAESREDKRTGFTDAIMSSWLHVSPLCSFDIRLTFQYSIANAGDLIEIYLVEKNRSRMRSLGRWKGVESNESIWQQGNITLKATEEFRIDFQIRHLPDRRNDSTVWFAIDDILIENCPTAIVNITRATYRIMESTTIPSTSELYSNESNAPSFSTSTWKSSDLRDEPPSSTFLRQNLLTLILYLLCALIALTLLIILFSIIVFTYRKHCFASPSSSPILDPRYRMGKGKANNRVGIQIENLDRESQDVKTIDTTVQPCFE